MSKKTFILDTNILLSDTNSIYAFDDNDVIIPFAVLEELDNQKSRQDEVGKNARVVSRKLDDLRALGNLNKGVQLPNGGTLRVLPTLTSMTVALPEELKTNGKVDNAIIAFAHSLKASHQPILVSNDVNVRVKCDSLEIASEAYEKMRVTDNRDEIYRGVSVIDVTPETLVDFYHNDAVFVPPEVLASKKLHPNEILVLKDHPSGSAGLARFIASDKPIRRINSNTNRDIFGLSPKNKEQCFALDLLLDDDVKLVTLIGPSGCGKTILAVAAGLHQVLGQGCKYEKLIISRPVQPLGKDIGFLPGTMEEKMDPWIAPIKDNLGFLMGNKRGKKVRSKKDGEPEVTFNQDPYLDRLFEDGKIEVEAITFIRGRSIPNAFIIIDEAQNLSNHELKTIITRAGEGTKIVLTGDIEQIDNVHVDIFTNGLTYAVERFKDYAIAGHITLQKGERSVLATIASQIL